MGMGWQLAALALFTHWSRHYLCASAAAIELALLHNFVWHLRYTWRDRRQGASAVLAQCMRFHLSNGLVSLLGNLLLMRVLVGVLGVAVVPANGIAILCCSGLNFLLGHRWTFAGRSVDVEA